VDIGRVEVPSVSTRKLVETFFGSALHAEYRNQDITAYMSCSLWLKMRKSNPINSIDIGHPSV